MSANVRAARRGSPPVTQGAFPAGEVVPAEATLPLVTVVVPAFNEAALLGTNIDRLCRVLERSRNAFHVEIVIVNDGSTDATAVVANSLAARWPTVRVVHHRVNQQLGGALRTGFANSRGDYVVTLDGDLSYGPELVAELVVAIRESGAAIVVASPYRAEGRTTAVPFVRRILSRSANRFLAAVDGGGLTTITGMVRIYDGDFVRQLDLRARDVAINAEIISKARTLNAAIVEIPAHLDWTAQRAASRVSTLRVGRSLRSYVWAGFLFRPARFFTVPAVALLTLATGVALWFGTARAAAVAAVAALAVMAFQLFLAAVLVTQAKTYFDDQFHLGSRQRGDVARWAARRDDRDLRSTRNARSPR